MAHHLRLVQQVTGNPDLKLLLDLDKLTYTEYHPCAGEVINKIPLSGKFDLVFFCPDGDKGAGRIFASAFALLLVKLMTGLELDPKACAIGCTFCPTSHELSRGLRPELATLAVLRAEGINTWAVDARTYRTHQAYIEGLEMLDLLPDRPEVTADQPQLLRRSFGLIWDVLKHAFAGQ